MKYAEEMAVHTWNNVNVMFEQYKSDYKQGVMEAIDQCLTSVADSGRDSARFLPKDLPIPKEIFKACHMEILEDIRCELVDLGYDVFITDNDRPLINNAVKDIVETIYVSWHTKYLLLLRAKHER